MLGIAPARCHACDILIGKLSERWDPLVSILSCERIATVSQQCADLRRLLARLLQRHRAYARSEEHTSELQSRPHLVCRLLLEKKKNTSTKHYSTRLTT